MASNPNKLLSTLVFFTIIITFPTTTTSQECPYPCYPPPTGPGNNPPVATTPPASMTPPTSFSPPAISTTPPAGYYPLTQPPPYSYSATPPLPEPRVPWFPYYYKRPPHQDAQSSSSVTLGGSINLLVIMTLPIFLLVNFN